MDSAADGLLALSNTAVALTDNIPEAQDDDRSSSLSELEDAPDNLDMDMDMDLATAQAEQDSEAETERLEESPDKLKKKPFGISPSKLAQSISVDDRPEIEALTDSGVSSPISALDDSDESDTEQAALPPKMKLLDQPLNNKRKRLSDVLEDEDESRVRRRRTGSIDSDEEKEGIDSDNEDMRGRRSRELTVEPLIDIESRAQSEQPHENTHAQEQEQPGSSDEGKSKKPVHLGRSTRRRGREPVEHDIEEENEAQESEDEVDVDDAEAQAKSAEEQAKRAAAMEALTALEQRFATLRDRLYDERIAQINHELAQLAENKPSHPELLRQLECVGRYRDRKFEIEQNTLVYKVAALKRKSVAERSQIHSAYFQTIRDIREKHLERMSEQFYRIQQHRFKSNTTTPVYTIPFPEKRSVQITQQTAYNKEVSVLSGIAKWVGFPAAPELSASRPKELEADMEKMGISMQPVRTKLAPRIINPFESAISEKAAGQQFIEQTPWANPQHPINKLNMSRHISNKSPFNESYLTPVHQQRTLDTSQPVNSASTIPEHPSQPASSALNTPMDTTTQQPLSQTQVNGTTSLYRAPSTSISPTESRLPISSLFTSTLSSHQQRPASQPRDMPSGIANHQPSSPLTGKASLIAGDSLGSPRRTTSVQPPDRIVRNQTGSPFQRSLGTGVSVGNGGGLGRFGGR